MHGWSYASSTVTPLDGTKTRRYVPVPVCLLEQICNRNRSLTATICSAWFLYVPACVYVHTLVAMQATRYIGRLKCVSNPILCAALQMNIHRVVIYLTVISVTVVVTVSRRLFLEQSSSTVFVMENNLSTYISLRARNFSYWQLEDATSTNYSMLREARLSAEHEEIVNTSLDYNITSRGQVRKCQHSGYLKRCS